MSSGPEGMTRSRQLIEQVRGDAEIGATAVEVLDFVDRHPDALLRSCRDGHLTGSALVVDTTGDALVLMFHKKLQRWLQPGGHADGDGDLARVALREATEETGIAGLTVASDVVDIDIHRVDPPREEPHLHLDVRFLVRAPGGASLVGNHESLDVAWVRFEDLADYDADASLYRLARRGRALLI